MVGSPIIIIKNAFIELGGGTLKNKEEKEQIEKVIHQVVKGVFSFDLYITKMGSGYMVVVYVESENDDCGIQEYRLAQQEIKQKLMESFPVISV